MLVIHICTYLLASPMQLFPSCEKAKQLVV
jgi:hypothetical protein